MLPDGLLDELYDGLEVSLADGLRVLRAMLRNEPVHAVLAAGEKFFVHNGWDYYLYVTSHLPCSKSARKAHRLGLFVEPCRTPWSDDDTEEPYRAADDAFWARVDLLALHAGRPIALAEMPYRGVEHWHLVNAGDRPAMRERAVVSVYPRLGAGELTDGTTLWDAGVRPDLEAVLPDADGVVRARWTS
jgi:small subunit ribosomal protein S1